MILHLNISRKILTTAILSLLSVPFFAYLLSYTLINQIGVPPLPPQKIRFSVVSENPITLQVFFDEPEAGINDFSESYSLAFRIPKPNKFTPVQLTLPRYTRFNRLRIDFGEIAGNKVALSAITINDNGKDQKIPLQRIAKNFPKANDLMPPETRSQLIAFKTTGADPYIIIDKILPPKPIVHYYPETIRMWSWLAACAVSFLFFLTILFLTRNEKKVAFHHLLLIISAFFTLLLPLWGLRYNIDKDWKAEKRKLAEKKPFDLQRLFEYPEHYQKYFNDNFGYRKLLIYHYNYVLYKQFNQSPIPRNVVLGDDDWMFYYQDPDLLRIQYFTNEQLQVIKNNIEKRSAYFNERGIKFYVLIAPEKINIYNNFFPGFNPSQHTVHKLSQLDQYLRENSKVNFINPTQEMIASKDKYILYYKQDSHWNDIGSFFGYRELMKAINKDFPNLKALSFDDFSIVEKKIEKANISSMIGIDTTWKTGPFLEPRFKPQSTVINKYKHTEDEYSEILVREHSNKSLPRILIFRDSFGEFLVPYISETFGRSVYVFTNYIDESIVERENPDIVVYELSEGRLNLLLKY